ncbi:hypothetical protein CGRA01v4_09837 [Colletotrichum graminicola]|uniref:Uncharacterized protein n=1 Tax=Colletotrichum graminicola (strain M1.001 / M2 / FGSC 10212) TaxID=645133 RepID=E3QXQ0_COLGM|nr:uncharacterized protein GLRG_10797 [Colletotrichum graminicola M1.001]EFQ35653.1 hypothetical protein GLRG_10797 [Colletotrichum graminicola M1.001]WDK18552.1 hypothetical protein CGRA01v4_09837 [Colletotrichum graminicola]
MAPNPSRKGPDLKMTMTTRANTGVQGNAGIQKITASKGTKNEKASKADSKENKFNTFHPFGTRLPRELAVMIIEEAVECGPAIAYAECKMDKYDSLRLALTNGKDGNASKFKELIRLAKLLPDFRCIIERRFGQSLDENVAKDPRLGIRKEKDLMVMNFNGRGVQFLNWITMAVISINRSELAPGIRNVGVRFNDAKCDGISICYGCAACVDDIVLKNSCAWELAFFCQNLSDADDIFVLVLLRGTDVVGNNVNKHANLMKTLIADSKTIRGHASFEDANRTWVEVSRHTPRAHLALVKSHVLLPVLSLCRAAQSINANQVSRLVGAQARRRVRFRVLVGSRWKDATLKI